MTQRHNGSRGFEIRKNEAEVRQAERDKRSPQEQLRFLDQNLGVGQGAKKERLRLCMQIIEDRKKFDEAVAPMKPVKTLKIMKRHV